MGLNHSKSFIISSYKCSIVVAASRLDSCATLSMGYSPVHGLTPTATCCRRFAALSESLPSWKSR